ncbi:hypothetical protein [Methylotetracoccus oryzae]|uniref:hypothetical protein n=1 Tax=Methylotetracoccus oryzae TaxID=1919059 RepID=UPI0013A5A8FA|nr:hypothetical protein [Methylotetracoccus oryzae]
MVVDNDVDSQGLIGPSVKFLQEFATLVVLLLRAALADDGPAVDVQCGEQSQRSSAF